MALASSMSSFCQQTWLAARRGPAPRLGAVRCLAASQRRFRQAYGPVADLVTAFLPSTTSQHFCRSRQQRHRSRGTALVLQASWNAEVEWSKAKVVDTQPAADGLQTMLVDIGPLGEGYQRVGQYLQIKVADSKPGYYAIASPPDPNNAGVIELLIKQQAGTAELLVQAQAGDEVEVSPVMGKGFPVDRVPAPQFPTLLLFATGTGISPIKAAIEAGALEASARQDVRLYYGTHSPESTAFKSLIPQWEAAGVKVIQVHSTAGKGYVQDVFAQEMGISDGAATGVLLCGQKAMSERLTELLLEQGVQQETILSNF